MTTIRSGLVLLAALTIQSLFTVFWPSTQRVLDLLLIPIVVCGTASTQRRTMLVGCASGLMRDAWFEAGVFGIGGFSRTLLGWALGAANARFDLNNPVGRGIAGAALALGDALADPLLRRLLDREAQWLAPLWLVLRVLVTGLLAASLGGIVRESDDFTCGTPGDVMDYRERWEHKDYLVGRELQRRIMLFRVVLVALLSAFLLNFWYLQVVRGSEYARLAETNRLRRIPAMPTRGVIFDRRSAVLAATRPSLDLLLLREGSAELQPQLEALSPIVGVPLDELLQRVERVRKQPAYVPLVLVEDLALEHVARIEARRERFPSLEVRETARRSYAEGELVGHALGHVGEATERDLDLVEGLRPGDIVGKSGLERYYDERLRGQRGWNLVTVNSLGRPVGDDWVGREPRHGGALRLSLDLRLQRTLLDALGDEAGAGVFLDPWTGEVLAMVSTPTYDPNLFADGLSSAAWQSIADDPRQPLHDRALASFYAPGSVFKVVLAVAGLESGTIRADNTVFCGGSIEFYGRRRLCWKRGGHGWVDLRKALAQSCNVYFYQLGRDLGIDRIHEYGRRFGLGLPSGIDLPGESPGVMPSREWKLENVREIWYPGDTISVAIGQGYVTATPLQLAAVLAAVSTDGRVVRPHLESGAPSNARPTGVSPATLAIVRDALRDAVEQGTGRAADVEGYPVAGKTGTAQLYRHSAGVDANELPEAERDHGWFAGWAPVDRPQIAFAVIVEHGGHGGTSAAPVVRRVLETFFGKDGESDAAPGGG